jgi:hypothetical protein
MISLLLNSRSSCLPSHICIDSHRKEVFRDKDTQRPKRCERQSTSGYNPGAHKEEDAQREKHKRLDEAKELQCKYVALCTGPVFVVLNLTFPYVYVY